MKKYISSNKIENKKCNSNPRQITKKDWDNAMKTLLKFGTHEKELVSRRTKNGIAKAKNKK